MAVEGSKSSLSKTSSGAIWVAMGIFFSRISGLIRERVFAHFFGSSAEGDAFKAALRIPNFLQNLFGEGVLSASFIPVFSSLLGQGKVKEARQLAWSIASFLFFTSSIFVALGVTFSSGLVSLLAPGFSGETRDLTIQIVQILFPGTGLLVLSAWCLGVLNSHKKFFLSYVAPVVWNFSFIVLLLWWGQGQEAQKNAILAAYALLLGSALQFLVQVPSTLKLLKQMDWVHPWRSESSKVVIKNFVPVVFSRGVVQTSAYIDNMIASVLPTGAISVLAYAQTIYLLPISLFGMSISAAELPSFSREKEGEDLGQRLQNRLQNSLSQMSFFVIPSMVACLVLGMSIVSLLFQTGAFAKETSKLVAWVLAAASVGLLANTQARLYSSVFYALKLPKVPLRAAILRVVISSFAGVTLTLWLAPRLGVPDEMAVVVLAFATGVLAWLEFFYLKYQLQKKFQVGASVGTDQLKLLIVAGVAAAVAGALQTFLEVQIHLKSVLVLSCFGILYFLGTLVIGHPTALRFKGRFLKS